MSGVTVKNVTVAGQIKTEPIVITGFVNVGQRGKDGAQASQELLDQFQERLQLLESQSDFLDLNTLDPLP